MANGLGSITYQMRNGKKYWTGRVVIGKDENGELVRKSFSSFKKSVVLDKMAEAKKKSPYATSIRKTQVTLGDGMKAWLFDIKSKEIRSSSLNKYETCLRLRILPSAYSNVLVTDVSIENLQKYIYSLADEGYSRSLIKETLNLIKQYLDYCVMTGVIPVNPSTYVVIPKIETIKRDEKYKVFSQDEQAEVMRALDLDDVVEQMIFVDFLTGLRKSELRGFDWGTRRGSEIIIGKQLTRAYGFEEGIKTLDKNVVSPVKTSKSMRVVPLPKIAVDLLDGIYEHVAWKHKRLGVDLTDKSLIFTDDFLQPIEEKRPLRRLKKICGELGIEERTLHSVRHSYATRLFEMGVDIKTVQYLLGHSDYKTTVDIYVHVMDDHKTQAVKKLDNIQYIEKPRGEIVGNLLARNS